MLLRLNLLPPAPACLPDRLALGHDKHGYIRDTGNHLPALPTPAAHVQSLPLFHQMKNFRCLVSLDF